MTQAGNDNLNHLSQILNNLAARGLGITELETQRNALAAASKSFNGAATNVIGKIADALPQVNDYGSRWIMARMLRDLGLKNETDADTALKTLVTCFQNEKDSGTRAMACGQMRDLAIAYEPLSGVAAAAIALHLMAEKDPYSKNSIKNALLSIGMAFEAAAPTAVSFIGGELATEKDPAVRMMISSSLQDIASKHPSQAKAVIGLLVKAAATEDNNDAARKYAQDIAACGTGNNALVMDALSKGFREAKNIEVAAAYSHCQLQIGLKHPMPVIADIEKGWKDFNSDQRRMATLNLSRLGDLGFAEATASSAVLTAALSGETSSYNRKAIINGLMTCVRNKADETPVRELLKTEYEAEKDKETRELLSRSLRHLGYLTPVPVLVPFKASQP
jgi:hypothetical protein